MHTGPDGILLVDLQAEALSGLNTRLVAPLLPLESAPKPIRHLNPEMTFNGNPQVMVVQYMSAVRVAELGPAIGSVRAMNDRISRALDLLLHGV